jgi:hypothetical protein
MDGRQHATRIDGCEGCCRTTKDGRCEKPIVYIPSQELSRGKVTLALSVLPWIAWIFWLGRNDPWSDPVAHHHWLMKNIVSFASGICVSLVALILLLFGKGWKRILYVALAFGLMAFYTGTLLVGD